MNQRKLVVYIAATLDGYIATKGHDLAWLDQVEGEGDNGMADFESTVDTVVMGRTTYDWVMAHTDEFPYPGKACYVFSRTPREDTAHVSFVQEDVAAFARRLLEQEGKDVWIMGGGELISAFLREKLVDEIIVTVAPVLLGSGIPLFREHDGQTDLRLTGTRRFGQFVELRYAVIR